MKATTQSTLSSSPSSLRCGASREGGTNAVVVVAADAAAADADAAAAAAECRVGASFSDMDSTVRYYIPVVDHQCISVDIVEEKCGWTHNVWHVLAPKTPSKMKLHVSLGQQAVLLL